MTAHEGKMWNLIGALGWVESNHNYEAIENLLLQQDDDTIHSFRDFVNERLGDLYERVDNYEAETDNRCGNYGGDDSYGDMLSHVVGMGKLAFDTIMADPTRLDEIKFVENFNYAIPHDTEYAREEHTLGFHQTQAAECMKHLERITLENNPHEVDQDVILDLTARMIHLTQGNLVDACEGFIKEGSKGEAYRRFYQWDANDKMAMFSNTLYDAARKLIKH